LFCNALPSPSANRRLTRLKRAGILVWVLLLLGCSQPTITSHINPTAPQAALSATALTHLLAGEFAVQRGDSKQAAAHLLTAAADTGDLHTAKRATFAAQYSHDPKRLSQTSHLWTQLAPTDPTPWQYLAQAQAQVGNFDGALSSLQEELKRGGGDGLAHVASISISGAEQDFASTYKHYLSWLEQYPDQPQLLYALALLEQAKAQPQEAIKFITKALNQDPNNLHAQVLYGNLLLSTQAIVTANQYLSPLTQALKQTPHQLLVLHAQVLTLLTDYTHAYDYFNELTKRFPRDANFHYSAGLLAFETDTYRQVEHHLQQALTLNPDKHSAHYYLGLSAMKADQNNTAISHFEQVTLGPDQWAAIAELVNLQAPKLEQVDTYFKSLRQSHPDFTAEAYSLQAEYLLQLGEPEVAAHAYAAGTHLFPHHIGLLYGQALLAQSLNNSLLTEQLLERILAIEPSHINALNALGYTYAEQGIKLERAEALINKALAQAPDNAAIIDSLGWLNYRQGHLRQAKALLSKAYAILPDAEIAAHLGLVEWALGDTKGAFKTWNEALAKEPDNLLIKQAIMDAQNDFDHN
jgi:tetratricopeptide (TPR) repeat protein